MLLTIGQVHSFLEITGDVPLGGYPRSTSQFRKTFPLAGNETLLRRTFPLAIDETLLRCPELEKGIFYAYGNSTYKDFGPITAIGFASAQHPTVFHTVNRTRGFLGWYAKHNKCLGDLSNWNPLTYGLRVGVGKLEPLESLSQQDSEAILSGALVSIGA